MMVFCLFAMHKDKEANDAQQGKLDPWIVVHQDGQHANVGHKAAYFAEDVLLVDPHLAVVIQAAVVAWVVVTLREQILLSSLSTGNTKRKKKKGAVNGISESGGSYKLTHHEV